MYASAKLSLAKSSWTLTDDKHTQPTELRISQTKSLLWRPNFTSKCFMVLFAIKSSYILTKIRIEVFPPDPNYTIAQHTKNENRIKLWDKSRI